MKRLLILSLLMIQGLWGAEAAGADDYEGEAPVQVEQQPVTVKTSDGKELPYQYLGWSNTLNLNIEALPGLDEAIPVQVTATAFALVQDLCQQMEKNNGLFLHVPTWLLEDSEEIYDLLLAANYLDVTVGLDIFVTALYVAWLNANPIQAIIVRQNAVEACAIMLGIDLPKGWQTYDPYKTGTYTPQEWEKTINREWAQLVVDVSPHLRDGTINLAEHPGTIAHLVANGQMPAVYTGILYLRERNLTVCDAWNIPNPGQITKLSLSKNQLTAIQAGVFAGLDNLTDLDLSYNQLITLDAGAFNGLDKLRVLLLEDSQITIIYAGAFNGLDELTHFSLDYNRLTTLATDAFNGLDKLTYLSLKHNRLTTLATDAFNGLGALTHLYLDYNRLTTLASGAFNGLGALTHLYLNYNRLTTLASGAFNGLGALTHLYLNNNQITTIHAGAFNGLDKLTRFSLNHNRLTTLEAGAFTGLRALTYLDLSNNQLTAIQAGVFAGLLDVLTELRLEDNPELHLNDPNNLQAIRRQYYKRFWMRRLGDCIKKNRTLVVDREERYPGVFQRVYPEATQAVASAGDQEEDDAVCTQCNQIGNACTCSAEAAGN